MLDVLFLNKKTSLKIQISVRAIIALLAIITAVALPQIFHIIGGSSAGQRFLPMYYPVLFAGIILGFKRGLGIAIFSPITSYLFTSYFLSSPMPGINLLPFMIFELSVFAFVGGLFSNLMVKKIYLIPCAVCLAAILGRGSFLLSKYLFDGSSFDAALTQVYNSLVGLIILAAVVSTLAIIVRYFINEKVSIK